MQRIERTTHLAAPPEEVRAALERPGLLMHVAAPILVLRPLDPPALPERWQTGGRYRVAMRLFGVLPLGWQVIAVERPPAPAPAERLRDAGHGPLARRWDHVIETAPGAAGGTRYTDRVEIEAGALTLPVALFARLFYAHRQRRLRALFGDARPAGRPARRPQADRPPR